ncbi:MAG: hypothetical protein H6704_06775 [Myxococcales bacterium]|nr:hypothetical protein [Myxococcales bacterium]
MSETSQQGPGEAGGDEAGEDGQRDAALAAPPVGPLGRPPPADARLSEALAAFDAGDLRRARAALGATPRDALGEVDRATAAALERALRTDPAAYAVAAIMFGVWVFLVARLLV